jgi:hypothetical protein
MINNPISTRFNMSAARDASTQLLSRTLQTSATDTTSTCASRTTDSDFDRSSAFPVGVHTTAGALQTETYYRCTRQPSLASRRTIAHPVRFATIEEVCSRLFVVLQQGHDSTNSRLLIAEPALADLLMPPSSTCASLRFSPTQTCDGGERLVHVCVPCSTDSPTPVLGDLPISIGVSIRDLTGCANCTSDFARPSGSAFAFVDGGSRKRNGWIGRVAGICGKSKA